VLADIAFDGISARVTAEPPTRFMSDLASGLLMLRILRVGRAVAFGTRAGSVAVRDPHEVVRAMRDPTPTVSVIIADGDLHRLCLIGRASWHGPQSLLPRVSMLQASVTIFRRSRP
jgi:hypothetical protein